MCLYCVYNHGPWGLVSIECDNDHLGKNAWHRKCVGTLDGNHVRSSYRAIKNVEVRSTSAV